MTNPMEEHRQRDAHRAKLEAALAQLTTVTASLRQATRDHAQRVQVLAALGRRQEALIALRNAAELPIAASVDAEAIAFAAYGLGEHELARDCYAHVADLAPRDSLAWYNLASSERNLGNLEAAEAACDRSIALDRNAMQAALLRSYLRMQRPEKNHIEELRGMLRATPATEAHIFLNYALGKELDDLGAFDEAFSHFAEGARVRRLHLSYDVAEDVAKMRRIRTVYRSDMFARSYDAKAAGAFGFILGMPRSGTTLIERVMTGSPEVRSNGETDNLLAALMEGLAGDGPDIFARAAAADHQAVAGSYARRAGTAARLVLEKLPLNYLYAGAIGLALPDAPIIVVNRHPMDNCFGMFSTLFANAYPFSYSLQEVATYYLSYRALIDHWKECLGPQLIEVRYEDFIAQPQEVGRRIACHAGVKWNDSMVEIERNRSASATASAMQVRRPIYASAMGRWRNYEAHLQPMAEAFRSAGLL